jgi:hypothetical protein
MEKAHYPYYLSNISPILRYTLFHILIPLKLGCILTINDASLFGSFFLFIHNTKNNDVPYNLQHLRINKIQ